jgi:cation transporter-like permease
VYDIIKKEASLIRSAFLTLLIGLLFALLISCFCGPLYGWVTAIAVFLLSIKILVFYDAETIKERIYDSIVTASAVGILVGVIASILAGIIHGFLAGREFIYCGGSYELLAWVLASIAMFLFIFFYRNIIAATYANYNIYREQ